MVSDPPPAHTDPVPKTLVWFLYAAVALALVALLLAVAVLCPSGGILVAAAQVVVTLYVGVGLIRFARSQGEAAKAQAAFAAAQVQEAEVARSLSVAPVLAAEFERSRPREEEGTRIRVRNVGRGPVMELRANLYIKPAAEANDPDKYESLEVEPHADYLAPERDETLVVVKDFSSKRPREKRIRPHTTDIWIVHCGGVDGARWHAWSNMSRAGKPEPSGRFIFEHEGRTPKWIKDRCARCGEIDAIRRGEPAR